MGRTTFELIRDLDETLVNEAIGAGRPGRHNSLEFGSLSQFTTRSMRSTDPTPHPIVDKFVHDQLALHSQRGFIREWFYFDETKLIVYCIGNYRYCHNIGREHRSNGIRWHFDLLRGIWCVAHGSYVVIYPGINAASILNAATSARTTSKYPNHHCRNCPSDAERSCTKRRSFSAFKRPIASASWQRRRGRMTMITTTIRRRTCPRKRCGCRRSTIR